MNEYDSNRIIDFAKKINYVSKKVEEIRISGINISVKR